MEKDIQQVRRVGLQSIFLIVLIIAGVGIILLLQTKGSSTQSSNQPFLSKGQPAPGFTLPNLEDKMVSLSDFRGKVVLLNIWATWCPPCVEEMPSMEKLYQEMKGEAFEIMAVSIDTNGRQAVAPFMNKHKLSFPALTDTTGIMKNLYRTTGIPESVIIDKNGKVVDKVIGPRDWASPDALGFFRDLIRSH